MKIEIKNECNPSGRVPKRARKSIHDHDFSPSGVIKFYMCGPNAAAGYVKGVKKCATDGHHEACATCGWPADEHRDYPGRRP
jgi:hypothetical protein